MNKNNVLKFDESKRRCQKPINGIKTKIIDKYEKCFCDKWLWQALKQEEWVDRFVEMITDQYVYWMETSSYLLSEEFKIGCSYIWDFIYDLNFNTERWIKIKKTNFKDLEIASEKMEKCIYYFLKDPDDWMNFRNIQDYLNDWYNEIQVTHWESGSKLPIIIMNNLNLILPAIEKLAEEELLHINLD